jgi:anti-sigma B factor antagonist
MVVVKPAWNLDVAGAQRLEELIAPLDGTVNVDLSDVAFVASSGLRIFLKHAQRLKNSGGELRLSGANETIMSVFNMSGFADIITIES